MNLYLDTSALVKRYINEQGSEGVRSLIRTADYLATSIISRAEMAAAFTSALRMGKIDKADYESALTKLRGDWIDYWRLAVTEEIITRADRSACEHGLRGYDAVHLASLLTWQENLGRPVILATFDHELANAAHHWGLQVVPEP